MRQRRNYVVRQNEFHLVSAMNNPAANFAKAFTDTASGLSNFGPYSDAVRGSAAVGERLSKISLFSARESARISSHWTGDVIAGMQKVCRAKETPLEYSSAFAEFAADTADSSLRCFAEFGEVAPERHRGIPFVPHGMPERVKKRRGRPPRKKLRSQHWKKLARATKCQQDFIAIILLPVGDEVWRAKNGPPLLFGPVSA